MISKIYNMKLRKPDSKIFILLFLGTLSAFGPFVMDMYLPTLPEMTDYFSTTSSAVQLGLTTSMIGLAIGQMLFGPLSDRFGRRKPLIAAMSLFIISTLGCIYAGNISQFIALRLIQGIAGAGGVVLSRSIATDKYSAMELATMLGIIGSINGIATVAAPIAGGLMIGFGGWKGIFWCLFGIGVLILCGSIRMKETLSHSKMKKNSKEAFLGGTQAIFRNMKYLLYVLQYAFTMALLFTNVASAPFIMQEHYGISPVMFSLVFGLNAVAMAIATAMATRFKSMKKALTSGSYGMLAISILLLVSLSSGCNFWIYEGLLFLLLAMAGMSFTASNSLAMDCERDNAGIASAFLGAIGFSVGGFVSPLAGLGNIPVTSGIMFTIFAIMACICARKAIALPGPETTCCKQ